MRPTRLILAATALALAAPAPALAAAAQVRLVLCDSAERRATFQADMRRLAGTSRLQVRFTLQARMSRSSRWRRVAAPGLGTWNGSDPGVRRYVYSKTVEELVAPGRYRVLVRFRWLDALGLVVRRAQRISDVCRQRDARPDLEPVRVVVEPAAAADRRIYTVQVRNAGDAAATAFGATLTVGGAVLALERPAGIVAGATTTLRGEGPACRPGERLVVDVDTLAEVPERDEGDNELASACPG